MKNISIVYTAILFLLSVFFSVFVSAQTLIGGDISANTTWSLSGSPYEVNVNVLVDAEVTLTIDPGVVIKFDSARAMTVRGTLRAIGSPSSYITFTSNATSPKPGDWGYIDFDNESIRYDSVTGSGCVIDYCNIQYAGYTNLFISTPVIYCFGSTPKISHSSFQFNLGSCISTYMGIGDAYQFITDNYFAYNSMADAWGIIYGYVDSRIYLIFERNVFTNNNGALLYFKNCNGIISDNTIAENINSSTQIYVGGLIQLYMGGLIVERNLVTSNISYSDLFNLTLPIKFADNIISNNEIYYRSAVNIDEADSGFHFENNQIVQNILHEARAIQLGLGDYSIKGNVITQNAATLTSDNAVMGQNDGYPVLRYNDIYNNSSDANTFYCLWGSRSNTSNDFDASQNYWGTSNATDIADCIYDYFDALDLDVINYTPFLTTPEVNTPVTPPTGFIKKNLGNGSVQLTWNANPESDLMGYKIYWDKVNAYTFKNSMDVGNVTSYTFSSADYNNVFAVTAYDNSLAGVKDQIYGHESWYAFDQLYNPATAVLPISSIKNPVTIYPNPMHDAATIETRNLHVPFQIQLFDVLGNLVHNETITTDRFTLYRNELVGGIYFFRLIKNGESLAEGKIVIE